MQASEAGLSVCDRTTYVSGGGLRCKIQSMWSKVRLQHHTYRELG